MDKILLLNDSHATLYDKLRLEALQDSPTAFATDYEEYVNRKDRIQRVKNNLMKDSAFTVGAFQDDQLVGVATMVIHEQSKLKHKAEIYAVYVSPTQRGRSIGYHLLQKLMKVAKTKNIEQLLLTVEANNQKAICLYQRAGFKQIGIEKNAMKINDIYYDEAYMQKMLTTN
ncbi:hypothetical protein Q73_07315 [Bacillus coahuilensis m2-6]|uniref:GNAT family N-acetyltransferase n=1 Tax=Bacillus coahuilensis TaxID=408580 RepID=UPI0001850C4B|nr:GNAT family N-acetyltransferase [Bacillus coahuilensis]KUP08162.1 hypothetical protein Q73_07315 [Bacillus coahuilensis m2-6]